MSVKIIIVSVLEKTVGSFVRLTEFGDRMTMFVDKGLCPHYNDIYKCIMKT